MNTTEPQLIADSEIQRAGDALGRAFFNDPLQKYFLPDEEARRSLSPQHLSRVVRYGHLLGQVFTTKDTAGAAVWLPPGETEMTDDRLEQAGLMDVGAIVGEAALSRFLGVMDFLEPFHKRDASDPHWYLLVLGVDTALQRGGFGGSLARAGVERADADGVPCYLETANETNVPFYQKQGFDVVVDTVDPTSGLRLWTFRREPRR